MTWRRKKWSRERYRRYKLVSFFPLPLSTEDILTFCILKIKEQIRRLERKNRDEFRKLMEGHIATGVLTAKTHWRDYCMQVLSESWSVYNYIQNL